MLPIEHLISEVQLKKGISLADLIRGMGLTNINKGLRRIRGLFNGDFQKSKDLIARLPNVLGVSAEQVEMAIRASKEILASNADREWRRDFTPHGLILTSANGRPRQITMAAICGADRHTRIAFPANMPTSEYFSYAMESMAKQSEEVRKFFYDIEGLVINWSPDHATHYDILGSIVRELTAAKRPGELSFSLR